ncbi:MAG: SRPBCC domain-containing protein [Planctomycetales bacterium]|nr:SRPBCC domain-containing protein [bacterium]UNM09663.1 MAG: SRPBCC domain-containing protein [Planctomycetales bacterium]
MTDNALPVVSLNRMEVQAEYTIAAPPDRVWRALTEETQAWWGAPYKCCDDTVEISLELRGGGAMLEKGADGTHVVWGIISGFTPGSYLELEGSCGMAWPSFGNWSYMLSDNGNGGTILKFRHSALGLFKPEQQQNYGRGWDDLLGERLRNWCENGTRLGLGHEPEWARQQA